MPPHGLAQAFLAGEPDFEAVVERATQMLGPWAWIPRVARRLIKAFPPERTRPRHSDVVRFLWRDAGFRRVSRKLRIQSWITASPTMQPVPTAESWDVPPIETTAALAAWLQISLSDLEWFADLRGLNGKSASPLAHYHYRVLTKPSGAIRLIEAPKPRLKQLQRRILAGILEKIPAHQAVHGFLKGHSIKTFAGPHVGKRVVLKMDLEDFFPSISRARIQAVFRTMGYPEPVADRLGGLCATVAPHECGIYSAPHLPQGAPTSPALANLSAYRFDCRLLGLAKSAGAVYTRYADDLAFSGGGDFKRCVERFSIHAAVILGEEGFQVHHRKTRIMRSSVRQQLAGLVANERINVRRSDFDNLKATLNNCVRLGLESQNRENHPNFRMHLQGKVAFVESIHPGRGKRLRVLLDRIT